MNTAITLILLSLYASGVICHHYYYQGEALPHVLPDGHLADTPAVAAAKAEHYVAVAHAQARGNPYNSGYYRYYDDREVPYIHAPESYPIVLPSGFLQDTYEVAAAKHHHLASTHEPKYYFDNNGHIRTNYYNY